MNALIANALATIESTDVRVEPRTLEGRRRNDIAVRGRGISGRRALDYDIKIYSLHDSDAHLTTTRPPTDMSLVQNTFSQAVRYLNKVDMTATDRAPEATAEFRAIVISTDESAKWKRELGEWTYEKMMGRISLELLKSRARLFEA